MVAVALPEAGLILGDELEAAHPLGALPEVEMRHDQPQRPAVLRRDVLAVAREREQYVVAVQVVERAGWR